MPVRRLSAALILMTAGVLVASCGRKPAVRRVSGPPDPWKITSYDPSGGYGTYLGNGSIGVRLHAEGVGSHGGRPLQCLMAGLYKDEQLVPLPNFSNLPIYDGDTPADGKRFVIDPDEAYQQDLDLKSGILRTRCTLRQGRHVMTADTSFILSRDADEARVLMTVVPSFTGRLTARSGFGAIPQGLKLVSVGQAGSDGRRITCRVEGQPDTVTMLTSFSAGKQRMTSRATRDRLASDLTFDVEKGRPLTLRKTVIVSRGTGIAESLPERDAVKAADASRKAWGKLWDSRIEIEGDDHAQQAVNTCLFYLLESVRKDSGSSIPPMGLSSDAWHGHVFWDADTWMFPALLPLHPELAKDIVDYRFKTLEGAKQNAEKHGLKGAEYAWESAGTGLETIGEPYCDERHITSDVALAQWQYYQVAQDKSWLAKYGYPVIRACADYWTTRVKFSSAKDRWEILNIMPPDEDALIVNNNAYTNAGAKRTLEIAAEAARVLGKPVPPQWKQIASGIYIPFDEKNKRFVEYDGFNRRNTKQADTELLIYPLESPMSETVKANTFDFWAKKVDPRGPAMSSSVHAVIAAQMGRTEEAYKYFLDSYEPFFRPPFNYFNEKRSKTYENMCFLTGAAGPVQAVTYGFCGLRYRPDGSISLSPHLPKKWKSVTLRGIYSNGKRCDIVIRRGQKPQITASAP